MVPRSSMVMMPSTAVSRIARKPFLAVAQRGRRAALPLRPRSRGLFGFELLNPRQQPGSGHFPVVLHFKDEGNIGKSRAAANLK